MPIIHAKSPCCRETIYRFGNRRRQCRACGRTWRIRRKKTGRKPKRSSSRLPLQFAGYGRITAWAKTRRVSSSTASEQLASALRRFLKQNNKLPRGPYALVGDGLYFKFKRMDWVMYVMALKPVRSDRAFFLNPVLLEGKEGYERWRIAIATIPPEIKKQIKAFVSDGFRGSKLIAREHGWVHQRCHFHLLMALIRRHGRRSYRVKSAGVRERMLCAVRLLLTAADANTLRRQKLKAQRLLVHPLCPPWIRIQTIEFLRTLDDFRACLIHPSLHLPTTTNSIESASKLIRKATSTARTPQSVLLRAKAFLRLKKSITCNGRFSTKLTE
jgi:transposase-like protein